MVCYRVASYPPGKTRENQGAKTGLRSLIVDGFDPDQIWEELQLHNVPFTKRAEKQVADLATVEDINLLEEFGYKSEESMEDSASEADGAQDSQM